MEEVGGRHQQKKKKSQAVSLVRGSKPGVKLGFSEEVEGWLCVVQQRVRAHGYSLKVGLQDFPFDELQTKH